MIVQRGISSVELGSTLNYIYDNVVEEIPWRDRENIIFVTYYRRVTIF